MFAVDATILWKQSQRQPVMYQLHSFSPPFPLEGGGGEGGGQLLVLILSVWADFKSSTMDICLYLLICFLSEKGHWELNFKCWS